MEGIIACSTALRNPEGLELHEQQSGFLRT